MKKTQPSYRVSLARLRFVFKKLLEAKGMTTRQALADEWEVSPKSIDRDVEFLRDLGADIRSNRDGYSEYGLFMHGPCCCPFCGDVKHAAPKNIPRSLAATKNLKLKT